MCINCLLAWIVYRSVRSPLRRLSHAHVIDELVDRVRVSAGVGLHNVKCLRVVDCGVFGCRT